MLMPDEIVFCPGCGRKREPDGAFCSGCGRQLDAPTSEVGREPRWPQEGQSPEQKPWAPRRSIWIMAIIVGLLALTFLLAIGSGISVGSPQRESLRQVVSTEASDTEAASVQAIVLPTSTPSPTATSTPIPTYKPDPTDTPPPTVISTRTATSTSPPTQTPTNTSGPSMTSEVAILSPTSTPKLIPDKLGRLRVAAIRVGRLLLSKDPIKYAALYNFFPSELRAKCTVGEFSEFTLAGITLAETYLGSFDDLVYVLDEVRIEGELGFVTSHLERHGKVVDFGVITGAETSFVWRDDRWEIWLSPEFQAQAHPCAIEFAEAAPDVAQSTPTTATPTATPVSQEREQGASVESASQSQGIIGRWINDSGDSFTYVHTLFFEGGKPYLEAVRSDGTVTVLELTERRSPRGRRFDVIGGDGIYLLIVANGDLQSHSENGTLRMSARPAHSTTDSAQRPMSRIQFSCSEGRQKVADNHRTIFVAMSIYKLQFRCSPSFAQDGLIYVEWHWNDKWRRATYGITPDGKVRPADSNAQIIDQIAVYGPFALQLLRSQFFTWP